MKKENVEMIKVIREYIISSLKKGCSSPDHEPLARLVLEYDGKESEYDNVECKQCIAEIKLTEDTIKDLVKSISTI